MQQELARPNTQVIGSTNQQVPYLHTNTKNSSFLAMASALQYMGVRNHAFPLAVFNPELMRIDPHDPELNRNLKMAVMHECLVNPWYYFREVVRAPQTGATSYFEINRGNLAMLYTTLLCINNISVIPRQTYKTSSMATCLGWMYQFVSRNSKFAFFNKHPDNSKDMLSRFKESIETLPPWLQFKTRGDTNNVESISSELTKNSILTYSPASDPAKAQAKGRGLSVPIIWYDESEWIKYIQETYSAAAPAFSTASRQAAQNGFPHGIFQTTTPNNIDTPEGAFIESNIIGNALRFDESIYDMPAANIKNYVAEMSSIRYVHVEFTWQEMGFSQEWYHDQCVDLLNQPKEIAREIDLKRTVSNDTCPYPEEYIQAAENYIYPSYRDIRVNGKWVIKMIGRVDPKRPILITCDPASGMGGDNTAIVIWDLVYMRPIGWFTSNRITPLQTNALVEALISNVFPYALYAPERNFDHTMVERFYNGPHGNRLIWEYRERTMQVREDNSMSGQGTSKTQRIRELGFNTDSHNRRKMFEITLFSTLKDEPDAFRIERLIREIRCLVEERGKIQARKGFNDDLVMAWLIGYHMFLEPSQYKNFSKRRREMMNEWAKRPETIVDPQKNEKVMMEKRKHIEHDLGIKKFTTRAERTREFMKTVKNNNISNEGVFSDDEFAGAIQNDRFIVKNNPSHFAPHQIPDAALQSTTDTEISVEDNDEYLKKRRDKIKRKRKMIMDLNKKS